MENMENKNLGNGDFQQVENKNQELQEVEQNKANDELVENVADSVENQAKENENAELVDDFQKNNELTVENVENVENAENAKMDNENENKELDKEAFLQRAWYNDDTVQENLQNQASVVDDERENPADYERRPLMVDKQKSTIMGIFKNPSAFKDVFNQASNNMFNQASEGVRRLNRNPLYLVGFAGFLFLAFMAYSAVQTSNNTMMGGKKNEASSSDNSSVFAQNLAKGKGAGLVADGNRRNIIPPAPKQAIIENTQKPPLNEVLNNVRVEPLNPVPVVDEELAQLRSMRLRNLQNATSAPSSVQLGGRFAERNNTRNQQTQNGNQGKDVEAQLLALKQKENSEFFDAQKSFANGMDRINALRSPQGIAGLTGDDSTNIGQNLAVNELGGSDFDGGDRWHLNSKMQNPRTPFELRTGAVIPATLITGINSELGGQILGQVSQDVFDTATGDYLLIPQGSRLIGLYSSSVAYGQSRVLVAWQRIIFPDGKAFDVGSMSGADSAGYAGFNDKVDNHYVRLFASAFLMSAITAGITYSQNRWNSSGSSNNQRAGDALSEALGQQLGSVTSQLIQKNLNISPTLTIREGFRFNVVVSKDLTFEKPYESFDY